VISALRARMERLGSEPPAEQQATVMDAESRRQVQEIFAAFDKDGDGVLNRVRASRRASHSACRARAPVLPPRACQDTRLACCSCGGVSLQQRSGSQVRLAARSAHKPCLRCAYSFSSILAAARQAGGARHSTERTRAVRLAKLSGACAGGAGQLRQQHQPQRRVHAGPDGGDPGGGARESFRSQRRLPALATSEHGAPARSTARLSA